MADTALRFGLSRYHGREGLAERAAAFGAALGEALSTTVRVVLTADYDRLLEGVCVGGFDVAWMPPLLHARAAEEGALLAAVSQRAGARFYRSAILVRSEGAYRDLRSLRGARAAWSDPSSASGHLFPRLHLVTANVLLGGEKFYGSPSLAAAAVASGEADVCACFVTDSAHADRALAAEEIRSAVGAAAETLRVLDITDSIPSDGMVLAAPIDGWRQAQLRDALLGLHDRESGAAALRGLVGADRLVPVDEEVRRVLARLRAIAAPRRGVLRGFL